MTDRSNTQPPERRLADVVRQVKIAAADRGDVVVDMRDADRARLELVADELRSVMSDIDPADDRFDFGISVGQQPRLWIDAVAHVHMGKDRRIFRFVRDTRIGRMVISESGDVKQTADAVATYVAERVIEREKVLSGEFLPLGAFRDIASEADGEESRPAIAPRDPEEGADHPAAKERDVRGTQPAKSTTGRAEAATTATRGTGFVIGTLWFILGCVAGAAALIAAFWDRISAFVNP